MKKTGFQPVFFISQGVSLAKLRSNIKPEISDQQTERRSIWAPRPTSLLVRFS